MTFFSKVSRPFGASANVVIACYQNLYYKYCSLLFKSLDCSVNTFTFNALSLTSLDASVRRLTRDDRTPAWIAEYFPGVVIVILETVKKA